MSVTSDRFYPLQLTTTLFTGWAAFVAALWAPLCGRSEQCGLTWSSCILFLCISHTQLPWPLLGRPLCAFSTVCSCLVYCLFAWLNV